LAAGVSELPGRPAARAPGERVMRRLGAAGTLHVHGYDREAQLLAAGRSSTRTFLELHWSGPVLPRLHVSS
ncbi:hypothetical protein ABZ897_62335, partial [Nonomuraea sp. NPDC046802]|uniref:hypothetical protein n=1 Tax=Nonomuraea sp. NPDC046802 TaxID=3154919 RepID=UPI0033EEA761